MIIDEQKRLCIEYLVAGMSITEIAQKIGRSRQAIYDWLKNPEFKAALDERLQENKAQAEKIINSKLPEALYKIWALIEKSQSDKVKADLLKYWVDRQLGKPSTKVSVDMNDPNKDSAADLNDLIDEVLDE
ncbi:helix-turn-helix domain-containing protein [Thermosediminibacter oceani]|uniref:Homeodomain phBC6A51-type domain-containing protein n=1 Tax=Thermosediminibacter oceani (strain ATCC BAA-1034 / DSM 16646 / JW/IW-1228P) TaxID=555079 RepID=D9S3R4_THEOJ|nr:helix-turn-helix domain-containing protein [Thermosediminibacter oceani]ADL08041.1 hypothetical protein Toce_1285 [Thermosediminibacter oceani DSM 16646]